MAIDFPIDREQAGIGTGPLAVDDVWYKGSVAYTVVGFNPEGEAIWFGKASRRSGDPTLQEVLNSGNIASSTGSDTGSFQLTGTGTIITQASPGSVYLRDEVDGGRVELIKTSDSVEGRITIDDDSNMILESTANGVYVTDQAQDANGVVGTRTFRVEPSENYAKGVYNIFDPIFGGPVPVSFGPPGSGADVTTMTLIEKQPDNSWVKTTPEIVAGYEVRTFANWSPAFNRALQGNPVPGSQLKNGQIKTLVIPAGTYYCLDPVVRTEVVSLIGEGVQGSKIVMEIFDYNIPDNQEPTESDARHILWRASPVEIQSDKTISAGQFVFANKGSIQGISFQGHCNDYEKRPQDAEYPEDELDSEEDSDPTVGAYSTVLFHRKYDNDGIAFDVNNPDRAQPGLKNQQDSADMDSKIYNCRFGCKGAAGTRNGALKVIGRNMLITNCFFNTNHTAIVMTFPNRAGWDVATSAGLDPNDCSSNQSLNTESQGGVYGWRRCQILGNSFHLGRKAVALSIYGKYQMSGLVFDGNLSDIGGQMLYFESTGVVNGEGAELYDNGVGGGLKNCVFSNNSFANNDKNQRAVIKLDNGRFDGNIISGNSLFNSDNTYKATICNTVNSVKRCAHAIEIGYNPGEGGGNKNAVVRGLVISNNNFAYFTQSAIDVKSPYISGLMITGNYFNNIGIENVNNLDNDPDDVVSPNNPNAYCVRIRRETVYGICRDNYCIQEFGTSDDPMQVDNLVSNKSPTTFKSKDNEIRRFDPLLDIPDFSQVP